MAEKKESEPLQLKNQDQEQYDITVAFATRLIEQSSDIPPDFAKVIDEEFWNLI